MPRTGKGYGFINRTTGSISSPLDGAEERWVLYEAGATITPPAVVAFNGVGDATEVIAATPAGVVALVGVYDGEGGSGADINPTAQGGIKPKAGKVASDGDLIYVKVYGKVKCSVHPVTIAITDDLYKGMVLSDTVAGQLVPCVAHTITTDPWQAGIFNIDTRTVTVTATTYWRDVFVRLQ